MHGYQFEFNRGEAMDWLIAAPFSREASARWLGAFVPGARHRFSSVPAPYRHDRSRASTNVRGWANYFEHGWRGWAQARNSLSRLGVAAGVITCFPQIPLSVGLRDRFSLQHIPIVAWSFNLGELPGGIKRVASRFCLRAVDQFVVHSRGEVAACSEWLQLPEDRFRFVPLNRPVRSIELTEDHEHPFMLALGSARRDYRLLFEAMKGLTDIRLIVVAGAHAVAGLKVPPNIEVRGGLTLEQCHTLIQRARVSVIPIANAQTASGQVTLIDAMMFARPVVVTCCPGSLDYAQPDREVLMVPPGDVQAMREALQRLWDDQALRETIGQLARQRAIHEFSDEAAGKLLGEVLDAVEAHHLSVSG